MGLAEVSFGKPYFCELVLIQEKIRNPMGGVSAFLARKLLKRCASEITQSKDDLAWNFEPPKS